MCNFKVGDKIQVVEPAGFYLEKGSVHIAHEIYTKDNYTYVALSKSRGCGGWDINRFVKYEEKEKTVKIEIGKKYRMIGTHEPVRIICVDRKHYNYTCLGLYERKGSEEYLVYCDNNGNEAGSPLIEEVPAVNWSKVKVDTPIWIRNSADLPWHKRHFNRFDEELVYFWPNGFSSFTWVGASPLSNVTLDNCSLDEPK